MYMLHAPSSDPALYCLDLVLGGRLQLEQPAVNSIDYSEFGSSTIKPGFGVRQNDLAGGVKADERLSTRTR